MDQQVLPEMSDILMSQPLQRNEETSCDELDGNSPFRRMVTRSSVANRPRSERERSASGQRKPMPQLVIDETGDEYVTDAGELYVDRNEEKEKELSFAIDDRPTMVKEKALSDSANEECWVRGPKNTIMSARKERSVQFQSPDPMSALRVDQQRRVVELEDMESLPVTVMAARPKVIRSVGDVNSNVRRTVSQSAVDRVVYERPVEMRRVVSQPHRVQLVEPPTYEEVEYVVDDRLPSGEQNRLVTDVEYNTEDELGERRRQRTQRRLTVRRRVNEPMRIRPDLERERAGGDRLVKIVQNQRYGSEERYVPEERAYRPEYYVEEGTDGETDLEYRPAWGRYGQGLVERAPSLKVPKFTGQNWQTFINLFEVVAKRYRWNDVEMRERLEFALESDAQHILNRPGVNSWSYRRLRGELEVRYGQNKSICEAKNQLFELRRGVNQTAHSYADALENIAGAAKMPIREREGAVEVAFVYGLRDNPDLQHYVQAQMRLGVEESAVAIAARFEREFGTMACPRRQITRLDARQVNDENEGMTAEQVMIKENNLRYPTETKYVCSTQTKEDSENSSSHNRTRSDKETIEQLMMENAALKARMDGIDVGLGDLRHRYDDTQREQKEKNKRYWDNRNRENQERGRNNYQQRNQGNRRDNYQRQPNGYQQNGRYHRSEPTVERVAVDKSVTPETAPSQPKRE